MAKKVVFSAGALSVLKNAKEIYGSENFTIAELKAKGVNANPSHLAKLIRENLAVKDGSAIVNKRVVNTYKLTEIGLNFKIEA